MRRASGTHSRTGSSDAGYQVETAGDGESALKLIGKKNYSLLILDLKLPDRDGIEVLREARRLSPGLRGVIITAYPSVESAVEAMRLGAAEYLVKPLALSELERIVAENTAPNRAEIIAAADDTDRSNGNCSRSSTGQPMTPNFLRGCPSPLRRHSPSTGTSPVRKGRRSSTATSRG